MPEVTDALLGEVIAWVQRGRVIVHDPDIDQETLERRRSTLLGLALEVRELRAANAGLREELTREKTRYLYGDNR